MILVYHLINNDVGIDFNDFFTTPTITSTRGHIYKPSVTTRLIFFNQSNRDWNNYIITALTLNRFKNELDHFLNEKMTEF